MCNYSDFVWNRGKKEGKAEALVSLMESMKYTIEQAMSVLNIPNDEWDDYRSIVAQLEAHPAQ